MITVPSLDPCTDIENTDKVMITHANGTTETITGELLNKRNQVIIASTKTLTGTPLKTGNVVRVLFNADQSAADGNTAMVINYNSSNKTVKVCKNGALTNYLPFEVSTGVYKYCQAYTTLELLYDGTNFIIIGNPVVLSGTDYTIFADGLKRVNTYNESDKGMITSNAVKQALDENIPIPTDAILHYSFDEVPDYPDGSADVRLLDNNTYDIQSMSQKFLNNGGCSFTNTNGNVQLNVATASTSGGYGGYIPNQYVKGKIIKLLLNVTSIGSGVIHIRKGYTAIKTISAIGKYEVLVNFTSSETTDFYIVAEQNTFTVLIEQIYIGDGSYSTPIIDNTNGQFNATNNGGIAVQGVSGKGLITVSQNSKVVLSNGVLPIKRTFSIWCWLPNTDWGSSIKRLWGFNLANYINLNIVNNIHRIIAISRNAGGNDTLVYYDVEQLLEQWIHIVIVDDFSTNGGSKTIYINGKNVAQTVATGDFTGVTDANPWTLLSYSHIAQTGAIEGLKADDFLLFDRALTEQEVKALYLNKANTPKYYTLNDYKLAKKLPPPPAADGNYTLKVNVASGVETYSWV